MDFNQAERLVRKNIRPADLYSVTEAAAMAKMNPFSVWKLIRQGRVRAYGWPGSLRVSLSDLLPEYRGKRNQGD